MPVSGSHHARAPIDKLVTAYAINAPSALGEDLFVVVPSASNNRSRVVAWPAKTPLPVAGDECLVAVDENGNPWVVAWVSDLRATPTPPPALVTALPGSPIDGEEVLFQNTAMGTAGIIWRLRYRAASASTHKWEFVGGAALYASTVGSVSTASTTYVALTGGPSILLPLAGDYEMGLGAQLQNATLNGGALAAIKLGAAVASDNDAVFMAINPASLTLYLSHEMTRPALAAGASLEMVYRCEAGTAVFVRREMWCRPVRVG